MVGISSYLYVSPSVERLRGYTPEELLSQRAPQTLDAGEAARVLGLPRARAAAFRAGETTPETFYSEELQLPCKDGSTVWAEVITSYYVDEESGRVQVRGARSQSLSVPSGTCTAAASASCSATCRRWA